MAAGTDAKKLNMTNKRVLSLTDLKDRLFGYNLDKATDTIKRIFPTDGHFGTSVAITATGNNKVNVAAAAAVEATDGLGNIINPGAADARLQNINIPPDAGTDYYLSLVSATVEDPHTGDTENPVIADGTGTLQYQNFVEDIGYLQNPTSVVDDGDGTITMNVNSLFASGEDHSGRTVRVWLASTDDGGPGPQTSEKAGSFPASVDVCFDEVTVTFSTPNNEISIEHNFGQETTSTTAADYKVMLVGPRVSQTNLFAQAGEFGVGFVTSVASGNPITVIDTSSQASVAFDLAFLDNITRIGTNGDLKIDVKANASDSGEDQIRVTDAGAVVVFQVDEDGNVTLAGDLNVGGTEVITESQLVNGDIFIGDDAGDTMTVQAQSEYLPGAHINLGDGTEALPNNNIVWDSSGDDITMEYDDTSQISLYRNDASGTPSQFVVQQKGAGGGFGIKTDGQLTLTDGTTDYDFDISTSDLVLSVNSASARTFEFTNSGLGTAHLKIEGSFEMSGSSAADGIVNASGKALSFNDTNLSAAVPLTASGVTGLTSGGSVIGDINNLFTGQSNSRQNGVVDLSGLVVSDGAGDSVDITAGSAVINGTTYTYTGTTNVATSGTGTQNNWVYIDGADGVVKVTTTKSTAFSLSNLVLAVADGTGANPNTMRAGIPRMTQRTNVSLGNSNTPNNWADFDSLTEALNFVKYWDDQYDSKNRPQVEIIITGEVDFSGLSYEFGSEHDGLIIRGSRRGGNVRIITDLTTPDVFTLNGVSRLAFEDIEITTTETVSTTLFRLETAASHLILKNFRFIDTASNGTSLVRFLRNVVSGSTLDFENVYIDVSGSNSRSVWQMDQPCLCRWRTVHVDHVQGGTTSVGSYELFYTSFGSIIENYYQVGGNGGTTFNFILKGTGTYIGCTWESMNDYPFMFDTTNVVMEGCFWLGGIGNTTALFRTQGTDPKVMFTGCLFSKGTAGSPSGYLFRSSLMVANTLMSFAGCVFTATGGVLTNAFLHDSANALVSIGGCSVDWVAHSNEAFAISAAGMAIDGLVIECSGGTRPNYGLVITGSPQSHANGVLTRGSNTGSVNGTSVDNPYIP